MLQDPKPPMNPKETSLMTHPDASMKMYDINKIKLNLKKKQQKSCFILLLAFLVYMFLLFRKMDVNAVQIA